MVEVTAVVEGLVFSVAVAVTVRAVANRSPFPYTVLLVAVGFVLSVTRPVTRFGATLAPLFSHDAILYLFLPAIVFQGAVEVDLREFWANLPAFGSMVLLGLPLAVAAIGWLGTYAFGFPLLLSLLFATMAYPIDPVAVLALFDEMGAPERLSVLLEGESLLDDGLAIVLYGTVVDLVLLAEGSPEGVHPLALGRLDAVFVDFVTVSGGGLAVGFGVGYAVYRVQHLTDDRMSDFLLTLVAGYGSFALAEDYLHVSGVLAAVAAGLLLGSVGKKYAVDEATMTFLDETWRALVFFLNTVLFILIGLQVSPGDLAEFLRPVLTATVLVLGVRASVVYLVINAVNVTLDDPVPPNYQHVIVWSGLHGVIPVALALGLRPRIPLQDQLRTMVFGVVVGSMVVQGLLMPKVLRVAGVVEAQ